jgi:hypothetical protein
MKEVSLEECSSNTYIVTNHVTDEKFLFVYGLVIAKKDDKHDVILDKYNWEYSAYTGRGRNHFLGEGVNDTRKKIESGEYQLKDLNH